MKTIVHSQISGHREWRIVSTLFALAGLMILASAASWASDPIGVFALVDKVTFEPAEGTPERMVIHGTFAIADGERGGKYKTPEKGYIYFKLPEEKTEVALKEWNDLKSVAGKKDIVGFGTRYGEAFKVRPSTAKPKEPETYRTGFGLVRMESRRANYPPIKAILEHSSKAATKQS